MCEFQNAYQLSQSEFSNGTAEIVERLQANPKLHAVVMSGPAYCRFTDAIIGTRYCAIAYHESLDAANEHASQVFEDSDGDLGDDELHVWSAESLAAKQEHDSKLAWIERGGNVGDDLPF